MAEPAPTRIYVRQLTLLACIATANLAIMGLPHVPSGPRLVASAGLLLVIALAIIRSPHADSPRGLIHLYFGMQAVFIAALLIVGAEGRRALAILYVITSAQATLFLPPVTGFMWVGVFVLGVTATFSYPAGLSDGLIELLPFPGVYVLFALVALLWRQADVARRESQRLLDELQAVNTQLQQYATRVEELAIVQERNRIAREIHDTLGHVLTALDVQSELLLRLPPDEVARRQVAEHTRQLVKQGLTDVRRAVQALRPVALESRPLPDAIGELVTDFEQSTGIATQWQVHGQVVTVPPRMALLLYRAAQESLTNVRRHAATTPQVAIDLTCTLAEIRLRVENAPPALAVAEPARGSGYGLTGLRQRAAALNGTFHAGASGDGGFCVELCLPL